MRRRRCTQGVSIRSCSVASPGIEPVGPRVEDVLVDRVGDEALAPVGLGARHVPLHEPDLAPVPQHEVVGAGLRGRPVDRTSRPRRLDSIRAPTSVTDEPSRMIECSTSLPRMRTPSPMAVKGPT